MMEFETIDDRLRQLMDFVILATVYGTAGDVHSNLVLRQSKLGGSSWTIKVSK